MTEVRPPAARVRVLAAVALAPGLRVLAAVAVLLTSVARAAPAGAQTLDRWSVAVPGGRTVPVAVFLPGSYDPARAWPLLLAMHGGPPGSEEAALRGADGMIGVWARAADEAGWIVVAPAMVSVVSRDGRTPERLPYEIFHPEEARAVVDSVRARYRVAPDRIVSTGISLGSNFSLAFAAAHPDWFSAIVPVSTEGESREHLLRNLSTVPVYVLEGAQDRNIRGVGGPRALGTILESFGADVVYREFADRAHEGFSEHYPEVLAWLDRRPLGAPREVLRVPHQGIVPVARRVHWVESAARQGLVRALVTRPDRIDVTARWTGEVTLYPPPDLVDLDRPLEVWVNGTRAFRGPVPRPAPTPAEEARPPGGRSPAGAAPVRVAVPHTPAAIAQGAALWTSLEPTHPEGPLSYWEMYATRALEERFPSVGFEGTEVPLPAGVPASAPEQVAVRVTGVEGASPAARAGLQAGDVLLTVGGEPFFRGRSAVAGLHARLLRELRETPVDQALEVWRDGRRATLTATWRLGPYRPTG